MARILTLLILISAAPLWARTPLTDVFCDEREAIVTLLQKTNGAERQGRGVRGPDTVVEIWTAPQTGEWTIVQSYSNGRSCIVAMGDHWDFDRPLPDPA